MDLTEAEDIKKSLQEYQKNCTEKGLEDPGNPDAVVS